MEYFLGNSPATDTNSQSSPSPQSKSKPPLQQAKWRCFLKGISPTHVLVTILPASYADLRLLLLTEERLSGTQPQVVKIFENLFEEPSEAKSYSEDYPIHTTNSSLNSSMASFFDYTRTFSFDKPKDLRARAKSGGTTSRGRKPSGGSYTPRNRAGSLDFNYRRKHGHLKTPPYSDTSRNMGFDSPDQIMPVSSFPQLETVHSTDVFQSLNDPSGATLLPESTKFWTHSTHAASSSHKPDTSSTSYASRSDSFSTQKSSVKPPVYGAITLPIYVYDCSMASVINFLTGHTETVEDVAINFSENITPQYHSSPMNKASGNSAAKPANREDSQDTEPLSK